MVRTKTGDTIAGVLKSEDAQTIQLDVPDKGLTTIKRADVDKRKGGLSAMPEDIAKTACFLLRNDSSPITGQVVTVDGGWAVSA